MASTSDIAKQCFAALAAHNLDGIRAYFGDPVTGDVRRALEQAAEAP